MRFAAVATIGGALVGGGALLGVALTPGMSAPEFVRAAQCAAYDSLDEAGPDPALRARLAFEQHAQPAAVVAQARAEIRAIGERAAQPDHADALQSERGVACGEGDSRFASGAARGPA